ncbi:hypothetical protein FACS1894203_2590 [Bacteroidia bacterium]|nr:hypothetical protein FACS1894203_2590 [Bacteroidia bacterium]
MYIMNNFKKYIGLLIVPFCLVMASCDGEEKYPDTTADETVIYEIKIVNGGSNGTETIVGKVDENTKEITFPEVHMESDLSHVKFDVKASERAQLDLEEYDFVVPEGATQRKRTIAIVNGLRKREYFVTIRLDVPVWGADFTKAVAYDFSGATRNIYPDLAAANTRAAHMDKDYVLIVSRDGGTRPHLLRISDLKQGKKDNPIMLKTTNISGGTFAVSGGRLSNGHVYICNMSTPPAGAVKIYYWDTPTSEPQVLYELTNQATGVSGRYGDYMSVNLDNNGNGYIYLGNNPSPAAILRLKVTGFTTISDPLVIAMTTFGGLWQSWNQVDGAADEYLYTGHQGPIVLTNANGGLLHTIPASVIPNAGGSDAFILNFNNERYLVVNEVPGTGTITVYDLSLGATTTEALERFEAGDRAPLIKYSLGGAVAAGTAAGSIGWFKEGNDKLYLFGAAPGAGFAILEVPKKVKNTN